MKTYMLATILILFSLPANAEWSKMFEVSYLIGESESQTSARQVALEQIKLSARRESGVFILNNTTLENGDLTESIQMISAAMIKVSQPEEKLYLNQAGQPVLKIKALVSIDDSELARRVEILNQDKDKARQVKRLQSENELLRKELEQIHNALAIRADPQKIAELLTRQNTAIKKMAENGQTVGEVFDRGTLVQLARQDTDDFEKDKKYFEDNFFPLIMDRRMVETTIESVQESEGAYIAWVLVKFNSPLMSAENILKPYFDAGRTEHNGSELQVYLAPSIPKLARISQYLANKSVVLKVSLAGQSIQLPVFYRNSDHMMLVGQYNRNDFKGVYNISNPIPLHLTHEEAEHAGSVEFEFVMADK